MTGMLSQEQLNSDEILRKDLETILRAVPSYLDIILEETVRLVGEYKLR